MNNKKTNQLANIPAIYLDENGSVTNEIGAKHGWFYRGEEIRELISQIEKQQVLNQRQQEIHHNRLIINPGVIRRNSTAHRICSKNKKGKYE